MADDDDLFDLDGTEVRVRDGHVECRFGGDPWKPAELTRWVTMYPPAGGHPGDAKARRLWEWLGERGIKPPR